MKDKEVPNGIVLFGYKASPYACRVQHYLAFRNIDYAYCKQPYILPRPHLNALGINYRRIPVLAIGRDVYLDSRCIIQRLEELFPPSPEHPALSTPETKAMAQLINRTVVDTGGVFTQAVQFIDWKARVEQDPAFVKDRSGFFGRNWKPEQMESPRADGIVHMRMVFQTMGDAFADGREWFANTKELSVADFEAAWPIDWLISDLNPPKEHFSPQIYPKTYAWIERYRKARDAAVARAAKPAQLTGDQAVEHITHADFSDREPRVDGHDPTGLQQNAHVELSPTDSGGLTHKDRGRLVKLTRDEVAIAVQSANGQVVRVHAPRWDFRIKAPEGNARL